MSGSSVALLIAAIWLVVTGADIAISLYMARVYREHTEQLRISGEQNERLTRSLIIRLEQIEEARK